MYNYRRKIITSMGCTPSPFAKRQRSGRAFDCWSALYCLYLSRHKYRFLRVTVVARVPNAEMYKIRLYLLQSPGTDADATLQQIHRGMHSPGRLAALNRCSKFSSAQQSRPESSKEGTLLGTRYLMPATPAVPGTGAQVAAPAPAQVPSPLLVWSFDLGASWAFPSLVQILRNSCLLVLLPITLPVSCINTHSL